MVRIVTAQTKKHYDCARDLFLQYADSLGVNLGDKHVHNVPRDKADAEKDDHGQQYEIGKDEQDSPNYIRSQNSFLSRFNSIIFVVSSFSHLTPFSPG